ncbi:prolipoprotein diacylglyceryl transferase [Hyphomonas johnsonii]|uniref:Phosphatidylglycerol--prolipoprotein diacylglyceryl transferase n=1 Tax=Hyphomonas johnsonii MHS-2 TaxID=1280950 RepID=A0A059FCS4_9PROT|nr:prolipoprotein diacylglyceryl transferase [Hyphomonas johnsonii]KCZ88346.1 prolipoprotein diacylglyceryl transferase [Hyphomonas johnsonii MHS-2]
MTDFLTLLAVPMAANALHFPEFSPAIFSIDLRFMGLGVFHLRWYALAYIAGIMLAWQYANAMLKRPTLFGGKSPATKDDLDDIMFWIILGIILGGRFGYVLFYMIPYQQDVIAADPLSVIRIWDGGMSFHGGLIGVIIAILVISRRRALRLLPLGDIAGVVAPIGIMFGRLANFINAELYGRKTDSAFGMIFPEGQVPGSTPPAYDWNAGQWVYTGFEFARHPSQLYEAALEGLVPLVIASILIWKFGALKKPGLVAGLFLLMYGTGRSIVENFRLPDSFASDLPLGLTMGMILSTPMWIGGAWLVWNALKPKPLHRID